ncbi:MAG: hypothetical protein Q8Q92_04940 [bacterium]|nr:hypothetical protein [bacterium]
MKSRLWKVIGAAIVVALIILLLGACANQPMSSVAAPSAVINVAGTFTVAPSSISIGNSVTVSWVSDSAIRVDACHSGQCVQIADQDTPGTSMLHAPDVPGEWQYKRYNTIAVPDVTVRTASDTVTIQVF